MNLADCYRLLGLDARASLAEIKASYRTLARRYHPDVNPGDRQAQEKFIAIAEAYQLLLKVANITEMAQKSYQPQPSPPPPPKPPQPQKSPEPTPRVAKVTKKEKPPTPEPEPLSEAEMLLKWQSYEQLQQMLRYQRYPRAIALVEGLAQRLPQDLEVRQWQAIAYQRWGRYLVDRGELDKARSYLKKALRTDPHNRSLWSEVKRDFDRIERVY